jgi:dTDP-4-dehydrorhamnose 3,5-epimerase
MRPCNLFVAGCIAAPQGRRPSREHWRPQCFLEEWELEIRVLPTALPGVVVIETDYFRDQRGFFIENYHRQRFVEHGITDEFVQDNHSRSGANVLRGIHYQDLTAPMGKLVRCTEGAIFDVAVDLRAGSPTFGTWLSFELSAENMRQVFVPSGFGHAFLTLTEHAQVQYKTSGYYTPAAEGTIAWDDPELAIAWPCRQPVLSERDRNGLTLAQYRENPAFP